MRKLICIQCPIGCHLTIDDTDLNNLIVSGNNCLRGAKYARDEITNPTRIITSIVEVIDGEIPACSVKSSSPIEKKLIFPVINEIKKIKIKAPITIGDIIIKNVLNTNVDIIATKSVMEDKNER